jgi:fimbrial isopeptide formation D2 family protein/uncharacterized repeat protein (TIGR01451 family)
MHSRHLVADQTKPSRPSHQRWTVLAAVNAMVMALSLTGFFVAASTPAAVAAGTPNLAIAVSGPSDALIQAPATPMTYTATVTNPSPNPNGYNLGYKVTLPPGVTFVSSSVGAPDVTTNSGGSTVLFFQNVADILTNSSNALSIDVLAPNATYPVNASVPVTIAAYSNSDPRTEPTMSGTTVSGGSGSASGSATSKIIAIKLTKSEPSPENELPRGVHDHATVYTLKVTTNGVQTNNAVVVDDYLPAGLEFLGCGTWDNTTNAPTATGTNLEYPGAQRLDASTTNQPMATLPVSGTTTGCLVPDSVTTVTIDPDGAGPAPTGVYTHVIWTIGAMAANSVLNLTYAAGIPMRENTPTWSGATPAAACTATDCGQAANLDNNSGPETTDEQDLTNVATAKGTYAGTVAPATSKNVSDTSELTVTAENLALQKSVDTPTIVRGGLSTWTMALQTGEYRSVGNDLVITDTLPNGLCPLGTANFEPAPQLSECNPVSGRLPSISVNGGAVSTIAYSGNPVEHADGTWTLTFAVPAGMAANSTLAITFPTRAREYFQKNFTNDAPVLANDSWTNTVAATSTATGVIAGTNVAGTPSPAPDASSAGQSSVNPAIDKQVSVPVANGVLTCGTATYIEADTVATAAAYYRPGDRVCYRVRLTLNDQATVGSALYFSNVDVTDFLPPGFAFEKLWGVNPATGQTSADQITTVVANTTANPLTWQLGTPSGSGTRYVDASTQKVFEVEFSALAPAAGAVPGGGILASANLAKATTVNSSGAATSLRDAASSLETRPSLSLNKSRTPSAAVVAPNSTIDYSVAVKNNAPLPDPQGFAGASNVTVRDLLPLEIRCATVSAISNGGTCTNPSPDVPGARSQINWTLAGPILPQDTQTLTYTVALPTDLAPAEDLTNDAGVRTYTGPVNTGGAPTTYIPSNNIDPTLTSNIPDVARDSETVALTPVGVVKQQQSELSESGNSRNAALSTSADHATIGEYVDYVVQTTIPASSTVYSGTFTDPLPSGLTLLTTGPNGVTPSAYLNGGPLPVNWSFNAATLTVTLADPYLVDNTADVVEMHFRAIVTDTAANAAGQNKVNAAHFAYKTEAAAIGAQPAQIVTNTGSTSLGIVEPSLGMSKTDNAPGKIANPGQVITYSLTSTNSGSAAHDVVLTDCVPAHLTVTTPVTPPALPVGVVTSTTTVDPGCATGTLITWTYPPSFALNQGAPTTVTYDATVDVPTVAGQTFVNSAKTTATSYQGANPDERTTYQATATDLVKTTPPAVTKTVTPLNATIGSQVDYTVTVTIPGGLTAYDATVRDSVPAGIDFESLTGVACANQPVGFTCPTPVAVSVLPNGGPSAATGGNLDFFIDDLPASPPGQDWTITLTYRASVVDAAGLTSGTTLTNTASLRWNQASRYNPGNLPDPTNASAFDLSSTEASSTVTLHEPKIVTDKDVTYTAATNAPCDQVHAATNGATDTDVCQISPDAASPSMTYTISVQNTGDWPAYDVAIADSADLPGPSQIASLTITDNGGTTVVDGLVSDITGLAFSYPGPLAPGATITITYTVELTPSAANHEGDQVVNTVTVPSFYGVPASERSANPARTYRTYSGGSDTDTVTLVYPKPQLTKAAVSDASDARIGQPFTYSLTVTNAATVASLYNANITDVLPAGWTYVPGSATVTAATGTTPSSITIGDPSVSGQTLTWSSVATLAPLGTFTVQYQAVPGASLATVGTTGGYAHENSATVTGSDATGAPANADGPYTATATAKVYIRQSDLQLTKSILTAGPYSYGEVVQYSVVVTNTGVDAATGVTVMDKLPAGLIFKSVVSNTAGAYDAVTGEWIVGNLAVNAPQTLVLSVQINAAGAIANDAQVSTSDQFDPDSTPGNMSGAPAEDDESRVSIVTSPTTLGDRIWYDLTKDGVQDPSEPGIAGVKVTLADPGPDGILGNGDDGPTLTATTDSNGTYVFSGLAVERPYQVSVDPATLPAGMVQTYDLDGAGTANTTTATIPLASGATGRSDVDFGYSGVGSIGDTVWFDVNGSTTATQDAGEPGIPGIPVKVTWAGVDGVLGTSDDVVFSTTTDASGKYLVPNLPYGPYTVVVDATSPKFPAGLSQTFDSDGIGTPSASAATLSSGTPNDLNQDFSYTGTASLGDRIWLDQNGDGVQDPGELGIPNVGVTVTYLGADGVAGGGDDIVFTTVTAADGSYLVDRLPAGSYTVSVNTATLPAGLTETYDLDAITSPNTTATTLTGGQNRRDVDFGYTGGARIGDQVWLDTQNNGDGTFDAATDRPLAGVAITVTYLGPDGVLGGGDDIVYTTVTDAQGKYLVDNLPLGNYTVTAVPPVALTETFDADGIGTASTSAVSLTPGAPQNLAQDFSYTGSGSIGDLVWDDLNANGSSQPPAVDPGEQGIGGVSLIPTWAGPDGVLGTPDDIVLPTVTTQGGAYLIPNLPAGSYTVAIDPATVPVGYVPTYDVDGGNLESSTVSLGAGQHRTDVDFGLREVADLMIVKSHPAGGIDAGGNVTFRITVTNLGPGVARTVEVLDTLPAGLTINDVTASGWTCTTVGQAITCDLTGDLISGGTAYFDVSTKTSVKAAPSVVNSATVTSTTPDINPDNNVSIDPVVVNAADLVLKKALVGTLVSGRNATYVLTISNLGPSTVAAGKVVVTDPLPGLLSAVSATSTDFNCSITGQNVVCTNKADYPAGSVSKITIVARVGKAATGVAITNTASVTGGFVDPTPNDEVDAATLTITRLPGTGSDVPWMIPLLTLALLAAGGSLLLVARRRRVRA